MSLRARGPLLPLLYIAAPEAARARVAALENGASDVAVWPCATVEIETRLHRFLALEACALALRRERAWTERQTERMNDQIEQVQEEIILRLTRAGGYRDRETGDHILRMARLCELIALELGFSAETSRFLYLAAQMHDVGKIGVPDAVLQKPGPLTAEERAVMESHTEIGREILRGSAFPLIQAAEFIAATHHERWDGTGYPNGLRGKDIPVAGRIAAVADVFDALTSNRAYKRSWSIEDARDALLRERGGHFDPDCVDALLRRFTEARGIVEFAEAA
ncbi:HD domain-containing protein [Salinarimonas soli]|uniref:HD domain-containing protein n=2 Tax=Salinarimonas soli TaxID=1638099 RepID=A0A5B2VHL8_9HYPH|nr:HD domain-containing protein [Salinarimonas soli]